METNRYESPTIQDLRVVGTFDNNGKIVRSKRCWATFKATENLSPLNAGAAMAGTRVMLTPARVFDYALSQPNIPVPYQPPPNARIVGFTVAAKSLLDQGYLASMSTALLPYTTAGSANPTIAIGIQRCPLGSASGTDDAKFRDTTIDFKARASTFTAAAAAANAPRALLDAAGTGVRNAATGFMTGDVMGSGTTNENPYAAYYQHLSPLTNPANAAANKHIGVLYENFDNALKINGGGPLRFAWDAPPALGPVTVATPGAITALNPGLALVLVLSTSRGTGAAAVATTGDCFTGNQIADLTLDITFELEFDKNNDALNPAALPGAWNVNDLQSVLE
jgi:hypothetical protein